MDNQFSRLRKLAEGINIWGWATLILSMLIALFIIISTSDYSPRIYTIAKVTGGGIGSAVLLFTLSELILLFIQIEINTRQEPGNAKLENGELWCCPKCTAMNNNKTFKCTSCSYSLK
jgi:hypothetical protein